MTKLIKNNDKYQLVQCILSISMEFNQFFNDFNPFLIDFEQVDWNKYIILIDFVATSKFQASNYVILKIWLKSDLIMKIFLAQVHSIA